MSPYQLRQIGNSPTLSHWFVSECSWTVGICVFLVTKRSKARKRRGTWYIGCLCHRRVVLNGEIVSVCLLTPISHTIIRTMRVRWNKQYETQLKLKQKSNYYYYYSSDSWIPLDGRATYIERRWLISHQENLTVLPFSIFLFSFSTAEIHYDTDVFFQ